MKKKVHHKNIQKIPLLLLSASILSFSGNSNAIDFSSVDTDSVKDYTSGYGGGNASGATSKVTEIAGNQASGAVDSLTGGATGKIDSLTGGALSSVTPTPSLDVSSISSGVSSISSAAPGSFVTGTCGGADFARQTSMATGFQATQNNIGTQISNATALLGTTIQTNAAKSSQANTQKLDEQKEQEKQIFEQQIKYDNQLAISQNLTESKKTISRDLDMDKLNTTNACATPSLSIMQRTGEKNAQQLAFSSSGKQRNFNRYVTRSSDMANIYKGVTDNDKLLDDILPPTSSTPTAIDQDSYGKEIYANGLIANPNPTPSLPDNLKKDPIGQKYNIAKTLQDKKIEAVQMVLNQKSARKLATIDVKDDSPANIVDATPVNSGLTDSNGDPIKISKIINGKTSPDALLEAQVLQYHQNQNWQMNLSEMFLSTKVEELTKISALSLDVLYKVYKELETSNILKAYEMQSQTAKDNDGLRDVFNRVKTN